VFGSLYGGIGVAAAVSYVLGAVLLELTDPRTTFVIAGGLGLLVSVASAVVLRRVSPTAAPGHDDHDK
jgi:predicted MFS family arabinose efflux permease